jgi:hypothetical protein
MDVHLTDLLHGYGIRSEAATRRGWAALTNGELVAAAANAGFTCVLTQDRRFANSAARSLESHPDLCIVVVCLAQRPWREYVERFREAWTSEPIAPVAGRVIQWPTPPLAASGTE